VRKFALRYTHCFTPEALYSEVLSPMAFGKFQDFLSGLVKVQRGLFVGNTPPTMDELLEKLMGNTGEVSAAIAARELLDLYSDLDDDSKLAFFMNLEQHFNANEESIKLAYEDYSAESTSANLNRLSRAAEPRRHELLRRLNQTPGATHDLVSMRTDLIRFTRDNPELRSVDETFVRLFTSWFGRGFLVLQTINWSTSAAILERIIRYEAVHEIKDWDDLRRRIDPPNRRCFAFFHPALTDEPLIFVEVALSDEVPGSINSILEDTAEGDVDPSKFTTATFYSISNCQPGLKNITFGNFLIKQVVNELQAEFPSITQFVTLSPIPGFHRWLSQESDDELEELKTLKAVIRSMPETDDSIHENGDAIKRLVFNYLLQAKKGKYPADPVSRFHLGNGAKIFQLHTAADMSEKGRTQSCGTMVNYLYDLSCVEQNHEKYVTEGNVEYSDKLKPLIIKR
jgi:malonyl-CoA decarboxylase